MQRILNFDEPLVSETEDFELVVGRRQAAALTFLALVVVALCSGASYLAGKAIAPREEAPVPMIKLEPAPAPATEATLVPPMFPSVTVASPAPVLEAPLFASPVAQAPLFPTENSPGARRIRSKRPCSAGRSPDAVRAWAPAVRRTRPEAPDLRARDG